MSDSFAGTQVDAGAAQPQTVALFVSDVHLQAGLPKTTQAFLDFLQQHASRARQLYLLGDLFEYWAGDDDRHDPFHQTIVHALRAVSEAGVELFWIAGNRDFLVGDELAEAVGMQRLPDPCTRTLCGQRIILSHGDAYCTDDHAYQAFRQQVREPSWQQGFLQQSLAARKQVIQGLRTQSQAAQREKSMDIMDVNPDAIAHLFGQCEARLMIHGHTHRPACHLTHQDGVQQVRHVLPDWEFDSPSVRGGWIALTADGVLRRHDWDGREIPDEETPA